MEILKCALFLVSQIATAVLTCHAQGQTVDAPKQGVGDAIEDIARWTEISELQPDLPSSILAAINKEDILTYVSPGYIFPKKNIGLQCQGVNADLSDVLEQHLASKSPQVQNQRRFGEANILGRQAFRLTIDARDLLPNNISPRCEIVSYPMEGSALPNANSFWIAFTFWADDWSKSADEQLIAQLHVQVPLNTILNPFVGLVVRGENLRLEIRNNANQQPSQASTSILTAAKIMMPKHQWVTLVMNGRTGNSENQKPFLRMWLNGESILNYSGPLGYNLPTGGYSYTKVGLYHWLNGNAWDNELPIRSLLISAFAVFNDPKDVYTLEKIQAAIKPTQLKRSN